MHQQIDIYLFIQRSINYLWCFSMYLRAGKLSAFFAQNKYHFITALYGHKSNGFMGIGIAVPFEKYNILDVDICTVGATLSLPKQAPPSILTSVYEKCFGKKESSWSVASKRSNRMISVVLEPVETDSYKKLRSATKRKVIFAIKYYFLC